MNAIPLFTREQAEAGFEQVAAHACGKCQRVTGNRLNGSFRDAQVCCAEPPKEPCKRCKRTRSSIYTEFCGIECRTIDGIESGEIQPVEYQGGPLHWDNDEKYFADASELEDFIYDRWCDDDTLTEEERQELTADERDELAVPTLVFECDTTPSKSMFRADSIIESALCDHFESDTVADYIGREEEKELQGLIDGWVEKHIGALESWYPDYKRPILVSSLVDRSKWGKEKQS